jgi:ectoine hydroxylase-related dioxygenase (phytanoyl-CoA dioxygenase family)
MVTVRLHLDDCGPDNGPLRVIPGSHTALLRDDALAARVAAGPEVACTAPAGGAVVMRPMILHASSPARSPAHRRVVHIEYAPDQPLDGGLEWAVG